MSETLQPPQQRMRALTPFIVPDADLFRYSSDFPPLNVAHPHYVEQTEEDWRLLHAQFTDAVKDGIIAPTAKLPCGMEHQDFCILYIKRETNARDIRSGKRPQRLSASSSSSS